MWIIGNTCNTDLHSKSNSVHLNTLVFPKCRLYSRHLWPGDEHYCLFTYPDLLLSGEAEFLPLPNRETAQSISPHRTSRSGSGSLYGEKCFSHVDIQTVLY